MAEVEPKKIEVKTPSAPETEVPTQTPKDITEEKAVIPHTPPPAEEKPDESITLAVIEKASEPVEEKVAVGSVNRDKVLARVATEKRLSLITAWEESEKSKAENKTHKNLSAVGSWESSKKATIEADLKNIEEKIEKKKAEYVEKMKNKIVAIHKAAEEKRAMIEAKRGEDLLKAEEMATKYRATGTGPKKLLGCF